MRSRTHDYLSGEELGWDVGEWGGEHLSRISKLLIFPESVPPSISRREDLTQFAMMLNANGLFASRSDALDFADWQQELNVDCEMHTPFVPIRCVAV